MPPWMPMPRETPPAARRRPGGRALMAVLAPVLLASLPLAGCSTSQGFPPQCPAMKLLRDAADYSAYTAGGHDVTNLVVEGHITAAPADCRPGGTGVVRATMRVAFSMIRGPAAAGREIGVPYLVTVTEGEHILDQKDFVLAVKFPSNVDRIGLTGAPIELSFPVSADKQASVYSIYVGFRLTPEQLSGNRSRGIR